MRSHSTADCGVGVLATISSALHPPKPCLILYIQGRSGSRLAVSLSTEAVKSENEEVLFVAFIYRSPNE